MTLVTKVRDRLAKWLDRRRSPRKEARIRAFYWDGAQSAPHDVRDISSVGAYIVTDMKWYCGTIMDLILEPGSAANNNCVRPQPACRLPCRVVRTTEDGIAVEFLHTSPREQRNFARLLETMIQKGGGGHVNGNGGNGAERGQSLIEFSLILPVLLLLIINVVNFGAFFFAWVTIANAARTGAQYMAMAGATVGGPRAPSTAAVTSIVTNDASGLPNSGSLNVRVCTNAGTSVCTGTGYAVAGPPDPESSPKYVTATVDVTYTYVPLVPSFTFTALGIHTTIPPTSMHRRAVMRVMQ